MKNEKEIRELSEKVFQKSDTNDFGAREWNRDLYGYQCAFQKGYNQAQNDMQSDIQDIAVKFARSLDLDFHKSSNKLGNVTYFIWQGYIKYEFENMNDVYDYWYKNIYTNGTK